MKYILYHKDTKVANIEFTDSGMYRYINGYYNKDLMPIGTKADDDVVHKKFGGWLEKRFLPANRTNRARILNFANCVKIEQLATKSYAISLNDCYWIKRADLKDEKPFWNNINPFRNPDNEFISNILMFNKIENVKKNFVSPSLTLPGPADKAWYFENNKFVLYKCGNKEFNYIDSINEYISTRLCFLLDIKSANYTFDQFPDGRLFTKCKCFCDENTEFIPFSNLSIDQGTIGRKGVLEFCRANGFKEDIDKLIIHDYILSVTKRDFTNIGFLRDSNTFEPISLAPIFGSGYSLWCDWRKHDIGVLDEASTFEASHEHQIKLVDDIEKYDFDALFNFPSEILSIYQRSSVDSEIARRISNEVEKRIKSLINLQNQKENEDEMDEILKKLNII